MRRNDALHLGIDFDEREIRLMLVGSKGGRPFVSRSAVEPLPSGALMNGVVLQIGETSAALRRGLDAIGVTSPLNAVVGIPAEQSIVRTISVPPSPDSEIGGLVASEVEHQGSLIPGGPYGFFPIHPPGGAPDGMQNLAVIGVDVSITQAFIEVVEGAGVRVAALEPTPLAMLRTATAELPGNASTFVLAIGALTTDAAYFVNGQLAAFRRLDLGTASLIVGGSGARVVKDESSDGSAEASEDFSRLDVEAADLLALDAQRTMDYVQRADRAAAIDRVRVVCERPEVDALATLLGKHFGIPVEVCRPAGNEDAESGIACPAAYGLAIRSFKNGIATPTVDLYTKQRTEAQRVETKRYFMGAVLVAALSVAVGIGGCVLYNGQIAAAQGRSARLREQTAAAQKEVAAALDLQAAAAERDKALRKEGVPVGPLMDYVVAGLDSGVGLKLVSIGDDLSVHIEGEARDEAALVRTAQALRASPVLLNVSVDRFDRADKQAGDTISFSISGQTVTADRVSIQGEKS